MQDEGSVALGRARDAEFRTAWADAVNDGRLPPPTAITGQFAFAEPLSDGRFALGVDRFGRETMCYSTSGPTLIPGDRADSFGMRKLDPQAIYDYFFFHVIPSPRTVFLDVHRLPAGHLGLWDGKAMNVRPYSSVKFEYSQPRTFEALRDEFRQLLDQAVKAELNDGPPACFLSGGTDSSTVAGHIKAIAGEVHAYSIGFDAAGYDEMEYARVAAKHFGARHHEYYVTPGDLVSNIGNVAAAFDQPFGNSSALPAYFCALRAKQDGVTKLLAGDGGDELFGGNTRYLAQQVYGLWHRVPTIVREGVIEPILAIRGAERVPILRKGRNYVRDAKLGLPDRLHHYNLLLRLGADNVFSQPFLAAVRPESVYEQMRQVWSAADTNNDVNRMLAYDWHYTLAESDLPKVRTTAQLAGIRVGYPLLDDPLVDFSMRLPVNYKIRRGELRWFFKEALRDFLPDAIIKKQKKGFGLPFGVWVTQHTALRTLARDSARSFATRGVVRPEFVDRLLDELLPQHPGYYGEMLWLLMMIEQWLRKQLPDWRYDSQS